MAKLAAFIVVVGAVVATVYGHGRFMKPAGRSSIWRLPEFQGQNPPINYDDDQLYCGSIHQVDDPGSNCGVCGDAASDPRPRENEIGGRFDKGIITGRYSQGQTIDVEIDLTTSHRGHMEWRLCANPQQETQECFNQNLLQLADGSGSKLAAVNSGMVYTQVKLPSGVRCDRCIIQWNYRAGNNWGDCGNGTSAVGCGPQETFRGCADVSIS